jgi:cell wall-associated NlpC family hydrolase
MAWNSVWRQGAAALAIGLVLQGCGTQGGPGGLRGEVVQAAMAEVGTRYAYGAQRPGEALDCSALIQHAHRAAGLDIPRISTAQQRASRPVDPDRARPGDLLFFRTAPGQYHVGLVVEEGRFVHASSSGNRVLVSRVDSPYWRTRVTGAGTYLN